MRFVAIFTVFLCMAIQAVMAGASTIDEVSSATPPIVKGTNDIYQYQTLAIDTAGNRYIVGNYLSSTVYTPDFNPFANQTDFHTSYGVFDGSITRYNADGTYAWTQTMGARNAQNFGHAVTVSPDGQTLYVSFRIRGGDLRIGESRFTSLDSVTTDRSAVLALNAADGSVKTGFGFDTVVNGQPGKSGFILVQSTDGAVCNSLLTDGERLYICGSAVGSLTISGKLLNTGGGTVDDAFVAALDPATGALLPTFGNQGAVILDEPSWEEAHAMALYNGTLYTVGELGWYANINDPPPFVTAGANDAFVLAIDAQTGARRTSFGVGQTGIQIFGGKTGERGNGITVLNDTVYFAGQIGSTQPGFAGIRGPNDTVYNKVFSFVAAINAQTGAPLSGFGNQGQGYFALYGTDTVWIPSITNDGEVLYAAGYYGRDPHLCMSGAQPTFFSGQSDAMVMAIAPQTGEAVTKWGGNNNSGVQTFNSDANDYSSTVAVHGNRVYWHGAFYGNNAGINGPGSYTTGKFSGFLTSFPAVQNIALDVSEKFTTYGTPPTLTARLSPTGCTGTVVFKANDQIIGTAPVINDTAVCAPSLLNCSIYDIKLEYSGDGTFAAFQRTYIGAVVVSPAQATVRAHAQVITQDQPIPALTYDLENLVFPQDAADFQIQLSTAAVAGVVGEYTISLQSINHTPNYIYNYVFANVTILPVLKLTSGPSVSPMGNLFVGDPLVFSCSANQPGASYSWSFGDGTPNGTTPASTHIYTAAGHYTVTLTCTHLNATVSGTLNVWVRAPLSDLSADSDEDGVANGVEVAAGSDPMDASSLPPAGGGGTPDPDPLPLKVSRLKIALKFREAAKDTARFTASWQGAAPTANEKITLRLDGFVQTLTVDAKGYATGTAVRAKVTSKKGTSTLKAIVGPGALAASLAAAGLNNTDEKGRAEDVTIALTINSAVYNATVPLRYKAKAGKTGSAKQSK